MNRASTGQPTSRDCVKTLGMFERLGEGSIKQGTMSYQRGPDRSQVQLLPACVEDYVSEDAPVRFIDAFVEGLDFQSMGFTHAQPKATGRPPYHPADLVKLYVYGYLNRIRSSRKLEAEARRNLDVIWLLRGLKPDFKTISDFRKDNRKAFKPLFRAFNLLCRQMGLFGADLVAIDGSRFKAVNSRHNNYSGQRLREIIAKVDSQIDTYMAEMDKQDTQGTTGMAQLDPKELREKIARLEQCKGRYAEYLKELEQSGNNEISLIDADSRMMRGAQNTCLVGYNVQVAVDDKHDLIVAQEVVQSSSDRGQLSAMALEAKETLQVQEIKAVADKGYHEADQLEACEKEGIETYVPAPGTTSGRTKDGREVFAKEQFRYDAQTDVYHCPGGEVLARSSSGTSRGKDYDLYYNRAACARCPIKGQCTSGPYRKIARRTNQEVVERAALRAAARPDLIARRGTEVEHVFGTMRNGQHDRFLMRGLEKVRGEFSLSALVYNLRRVLNLMSMDKLMKGLRKRRPNAKNSSTIGNWTLAICHRIGSMKGESEFTSHNVDMAFAI